MTAAEWEQAKAILAPALDFKSEADRLAFVAVSCGDDVSLRATVDALLAHHDHTWCDEPFLLRLRTALARAFMSAEEPPRQE